MTSRSAGRARPITADAGGDRGVWLLAVAGLCAVLLTPLLIVDVPPLLDYPNHLARLFVLASLPNDPVLSRFYAAHWSVIPNLGLDLVGPWLIHVMPVHVAGRVLIAVAVVLPVLGGIAYNRAIGGRWWSFGAGLVAYDSSLLDGFLNFQIAIGLALLLAALWLRWREDNPVRMVLLAMAGAPVLFACHLMGLVFFALLAGGAELFRLWRERTVVAVIRRGAVLAVIFAVPGFLYAISALSGLGGDAEFLPVGAKLLQLVTAFDGYDRALDLAAAAVAIGVPVACLGLRAGRFPGPAAIAMVLLLAAYLVAPFAWKGTYGLDTRFAVMLGFMLFAGFVPVDWPGWLRVAATVALVSVFAARMALLMTAWSAQRADLADLRAVLAPVQPGQAVYVAEAGLREAPAYWAANPRWRLLANGTRTGEHLGALALIEHRAYWPFEFDNPSQQPIETREPYRAMAERVGSLPDRGAAAIADLRGFDYVLLMAADAVPDLPGDRFRLLVRSGFAALYTVEKTKGDP
jgi:hypothetical protein